MTRIIDIARILSIDVVLGSIASGSMVVYLVGNPMPAIWWLALPLSVWVIYTLDHLLDAHRLKEAAHTDRHLFHHHHFGSISIVWAISFGLCIFVFPFLLPLPLLMLGVGMGVLVLIHLGLVRWVGNRVSWFFLKELGVGGIYAVGIWGAPFVLYPESCSIPLCILFGQFFGLVMINLLIFSIYECEIDELDGHTSFVRAIGIRHSRELIIGLACIIFALGGILSLWFDYQANWLLIQVIFFIMLTILMIVGFLTPFFQKNKRYRAYADGIFIIPALIWLY